MPSPVPFVPFCVLPSPEPVPFVPVLPVPSVLPLSPAFVPPAGVWDVEASPEPSVGFA